MDKKAGFVSLLFIGGVLFGGLYAFGGAAEQVTIDGVKDILGNDDVTSTSDRLFEFSEVSTQVGINYSYEKAPSITATGNNVMGNSGVYVADYNRDNWPDVLLIGGEQPVLLENTGGEFEPSGALPEIGAELRSAHFFDHDGDGWVDLLLLADKRKPVLLENNEGAFEKRDAGFDQPLDLPAGATTADFDGDGCLDLFIIQHGNWSQNLPAGFKNYSAPLYDDNGNPNRLYSGNCSSFSQVDDAGIRGSRWSLATDSADLNGDGLMDIHVANDFNRDVVYFNQGNRGFKEKILSEKTNRNGMSSEIADVNGDGRLDIFVTNIYYPEWAAERISTTLADKARGNNLLINQGNGSFVDRAIEYNVNEGGWGWAAIIADLDNDGDEELYHATQRVGFDHRVRFSDEEIRDLEGHDFYTAPVLMDKSNGTFTPVSSTVSGFRRVDERGAARLDFDRDGDVDILVSTTSSYHLYRNDVNDGNSVQIRVENEAGSLAVGAEVYVEPMASDSDSRRYPVSTNTDFHSQGSKFIHIGTGSASEVEIRVVRADGLDQLFHIQNGHRVVVSPAGIEKSVEFEDSAS